MKLLSLVSGLAAAVCISAATIPTPVKANEYISFGSANSGTSQYVYAGMMIGLARPHLPDLRITNEAVSSTTQNLDLLRRGEVQMAIVSPERLYYAVNGQGDYKDQKIPGAILWVMNDQATIMFVRADSDIKSFADLKGKRVNLGPAGSSNEVKNTKILEAYGYERKPGTKSDFTDLTAVRLSHPEAANALAEGAIDAAIATQPVPDPSFSEVGFSLPLRYIGVEEAMLPKVAEVYPWMWSTKVPAGSFKGQDADLVTIGDRNYVIGHATNLSEKAAYELTKTYVEQLLPEMAKQVNYLGPYAADPNLLAGPWPVAGHPGALKYYAERGITPQIVSP